MVLIRLAPSQRPQIRKDGPRQRGNHATPRQIMRARAFQKGADVQPVSISYYRDRPRHRLLLGYAALDGAETLKAVITLRATFGEIERARNKRRR
jgi:hypothetical protein